MHNPNDSHPQPAVNDYHHYEGNDHHSALISADAQISVGGHCDPLATTNIHADVLPCEGGLLDLHHDHSVMGMCVDPDYHV
jgi:hypothetical protein